VVHSTSPIFQRRKGSREGKYPVLAPQVGGAGARTGTKISWNLQVDVTIIA